jgi:hypothetical protein
VNDRPNNWPTDRASKIRCAVVAWNYRWPEQLESGVMFYMGERITRAEFIAVAGEMS